MKVFSLFSFRYLANGMTGLSKDKGLLKKNYEELVNALDLVGFTDEVRIVTVNFDCLCRTVIVTYKIHSFVSVNNYFVLTNRQYT